MKFTNCNPLIIADTGDLDGRWEVWCRRCGSHMADTLEEAKLLRDHHQPAPAWEPSEASKDWSEHSDPNWAETLHTPLP